MKRIVIKAAVAFFATLGILTYFSGTIEYQLLPVVTAMEASSGKLEESVTKSAVVGYTEEKGIFSPGDFYITDILVNVGDYVETGTAVLKIDAADFNLKKQEKSLEILTAQNELDTLKYDLRNFSGTYRELKDLKNSIAEKEQELQIMQTAFDNMTGNVDENGNVLCPGPGIILSVDVQEGESVTKGMELFQISENTENRSVTFELDQIERTRYKEGDACQVTYNYKAEGGKTTENKFLSCILTKIVYSEEEKKYTVSGQIQEAAPELELGEQVRVRLDPAGVNYDNLIPVSAVMENNGVKVVYVLKKKEDKTYYVKKRNVSIIESNDYLAAIDIELEYGDQIITSTSKSLKDGMQVRTE